MQDVFLQVLNFIGPDGYYARTFKEKEIMRDLEKKELVKKKPGTKRVYIINNKRSSNNIIDRNEFKQLLKKYFIESKTIQQPFVSIGELRKLFQLHGVIKEIFDQYLIELYEDNCIELEKSFTADEGNISGLNYKNKKYYSYILAID